MLIRSKTFAARAGKTALSRQAQSTTSLLRHFHPNYAEWVKKPQTKPEQTTANIALAKTKTASAILHTLKNNEAVKNAQAAALIQQLLGVDYFDSLFPGLTGHQVLLFKNNIPPLTLRHYCEVLSAAGFRGCVLDSQGIAPFTQIELSREHNIPDIINRVSGALDAQRPSLKR